MRADTVDGLAIPVDLCMKEATTFEAQVCDILIVAAFNRVTGQNGIAVVAMIVEYILAVGSRPHRIGQKFMLGLRWPLLVLLGVLFVETLNLLQKDQVGVQGS